MLTRIINGLFAAQSITNAIGTEIKPIETMQQSDVPPKAAIGQPAEKIYTTMSFKRHLICPKCKASTMKPYGDTIHRTHQQYICADNKCMYVVEVPGKTYPQIVTMDVPIDELPKGFITSVKSIPY